MRVLIFPNADTLRLVLSVDIIPTAITGRPVRASLPGRERILVELVEDDFSPDVLAALHRLGVQLGVPIRQLELRSYLCWAELLPLQPHRVPIPPGSPLLLAIPDTDLAGLWAAVQRLRPQTVRMMFPAETVGTSWVWVLLEAPPECAVPPEDDRLRRYRPWQPHGYILEGWEHPLGRLPPLATGTLALLHPDHPWSLLPEDAFLASPQSLPTATHPLDTPPLPAGTQPPPVVPLRLTLTADIRASTQESLWIFDATQREMLAEILQHSEERLLIPYHTASLRHTDGTTSTVILSRSGEAPNALLAGVRGYVRHPMLPRLFLPSGQRLRPDPRADRLTNWLALPDECLAWLTSDASGSVCVQSLPRSAFVPLTTLVRYETPPPVVYHPPSLNSALGTMPPFTLAVEAESTAQTGADSQNSRNLWNDHARPATRFGHWLSQSLGHWLRRLERTPQPPQQKSQPTSAATADTPETPEAHTERTRLRGHSDWTAQRQALERRALTLIPQSAGEMRGELWAELGRVYTALGNPTDGAICHLSAAWEQWSSSESHWDEWFQAEAKAARLGMSEPEAFLTKSPDVQSARLAAAYLSWRARTHPIGEVDATRVQELLFRIDLFEKDLPIKAVWLARLAAARLAGGDPLSLARCRERIFSRLTEAGPELELDLPAFLRFQEQAEPERFQIARDWLFRIREPLHRWIARQGINPGFPTVGRLQWAGLDAEVTNTTALANLMLAWGLSTLGDRTRARQLFLQSAATLSVENQNSAEEVAVCQHLLRLFQRRIDTAQGGRTKPIAPEEPIPEGELARYAIDKLVTNARSLDPYSTRNPYRGRDFSLGDDALGTLLHAWMEQRYPASEFPLERLFTQAEQNPTPEMLPRFTLAMLNTADQFTSAWVARI
ncbi:MAG: hypothetical protein LC104_15430, partial [Bacteroidales bacterium]|nr:hypothetical protein [Bacteroidales bacterium]